MKKVGLMHTLLLVIPALALVGYELTTYYSAKSEDYHQPELNAGGHFTQPELGDAKYEALLVRLAESDEKLADLSNRLEHLTREMALAQQDVAERQAQVASREARRSVEVKSVSVQSRFQYPAEATLATDGYLDTERDIIDAVASNMLQGGEILSTECRTGLCKIYHSNSPTGSTDFTNDDFASNLATSLGGEVSLYFDQEDGQSVVYVEVPGSL